MTRSSLVGSVCLLPLLFAGCSSDEVLNLANPEQEAAAVVAGASAEVLSPVIERLNLVEIFQDALAKAGLGQACSAVGECATGTWENCESPAGFDYTFDACLLDGEMVNGTLSASGSDIAGTVSYDLGVDDLSYSGYVTFSQSGNCIVETLSQFQVQDNSLASTFSGELTYCPGSSYPNGNLDLSMSGASSFSLDANFDGTQTAVIVFDSGLGTTYSCTAGLATGGTTCQ